MTETGATPTRQSTAAEAAGEREPSGTPFADALCAVDGTRRSFAAVEQAAILAGPRGQLTLLAVTAVEGEGVNQRAAISPERAQRELERAASIAQAAGVPCTSVIEPQGPPSQRVLERACGHDLLALGASSMSWLGNRFIESVADAALGSLTVPLLVAHALPHAERRFLERILVASDGMDGSDRMVELAARLAREHDSHVTLLHAMHAGERPPSIQRQADRLVAELDGACEVRVEEGAAAEQIVAVAKQEKSSLVIMNSRRLGGWKAIGSVSRRVVHDAHCSVLLTQPQ